LLLVAEAPGYRGEEGPRILEYQPESFAIHIQQEFLRSVGAVEGPLAREIELWRRTFGGMFDPRIDPNETFAFTNAIKFPILNNTRLLGEAAKRFATTRPISEADMGKIVEHGQAHLKDEIRFISPAVIVTFGKTAFDSVFSLRKAIGTVPSFEIISAPHPANPKHRWSGDQVLAACGVAARLAKNSQFKGR
jgi:hypothetical protein